MTQKNKRTSNGHTTAWMSIEPEKLTLLPPFVAEMVLDLASGAEANKGQAWKLCTQYYNEEALDELPIEDLSVYEIALVAPLWLHRSSTGRFSLSPLPLSTAVSPGTTLAWIVKREATNEQGIIAWRIVQASHEVESDAGNTPAEEGPQQNTEGVYRVDLRYTRLATRYVQAHNNREGEHAARVLNRTYDIGEYDGGEFTEHTITRVTGLEAEAALPGLEPAEKLGEFLDKKFEYQVYEKHFGPLPEINDGRSSGKD